MTYDKLVETDKSKLDSVSGIIEKIPLKIFVG
jgi:hypothetical protein